MKMFPAGPHHLVAIHLASRQAIEMTWRGRDGRDERINWRLNSDEAWQRASAKLHEIWTAEQPIDDITALLRALARDDA